MMRVLLKQSIYYFVLISVFLTSNIHASTIIVDNKNSNDKISNEQFKIKFKVVDNFGSNLDKVEFAVFADRANAETFLKSKTKISCIETVFSDNGVVSSKNFYSSNKNYYIVLASSDAKYYNHNTIYTFNSKYDNTYLTEKKKNDLGKIILSKTVLKQNVVWANKYKLKITKTDDFNNKLGGVVYNLYSNEKNAKLALSQVQSGQVPTTAGLLEVFNQTNGLGVSISNNFYETGTYYLVEKNSLGDRYKKQVSIITVVVKNGDSTDLMTETISNGQKVYTKEIYGNITKSENRFKIKIVDSPDKKNTSYLIFSSKADLNAYVKNPKANNYLEELYISNTVYSVSKKFYDKGTYYILELGSSDKNGKTFDINPKTLVNTEKDIYSGDNNNPYLYIKIFNMVPLTSIEANTIKSGDTIIPLAPPEGMNPEIKNGKYSVYKDNIYFRYTVFDENIVPIGYFRLSGGEKLHNYDVIKNLVSFKTIKTNPQTKEVTLVNKTWIIVIFLFVTLSFSFKIIKQKSNIINVK